MSEEKLSRWQEFMNDIRAHGDKSDADYVIRKLLESGEVKRCTADDCKEMLLALQRIVKVETKARVSVHQVHLVDNDFKIGAQDWPVMSPSSYLNWGLNAPEIKAQSLWDEKNREERGAPDDVRAIRKYLLETRDAQWSRQFPMIRIVDHDTGRLLNVVSTIHNSRLAQCSKPRLEIRLRQGVSPFVKAVGLVMGAVAVFATICSRLR